MLAVGREGLETALFLWAATEAAARRTGSTTSPFRAALGIAVAILLGYLIYRGALKINLTRFFTLTGVFLIIVAGGVLAYAVHDLQEAHVLPGLNNLAFDVSHVIPPTSWYGTLLKGLFNFSPATTKLEAAAWLLYGALLEDHVRARARRLDVVEQVRAVRALPDPAATSTASSSESCA